jgi:exodeoxyribonuclease VII large subunit
MDSTDFSHNNPALSVSELSQALKGVVENTFGDVRVRGEISGFKQAASGHIYFNLKDENAVLAAICWKGVSQRFAFKPEEGMEVICTGKLSTYPGRSSYQIIVEFMEPAGAGALLAMLEKRKAMFAAEGLFDAARKKQLPYLPRTIGIITSPTGAVIRDILHRLRERFPVEVLVWPVLVQGEGAKEQIAAAIHGFNAMETKPDLLIVARGGGSLEDLWAFNEEIVIRAVAASKIPLISAVGHETDTTLIDYVSDHRAPTPTAAAERAVPVRSELFALLNAYGERMKPQRILDPLTQKLDDWSERLKNALPQLLQVKTQQLATLSATLKPQLLLLNVTKMQSDVTRMGEKLNHAISLYQERLNTKLTQLSQLLASYSYEHTLKRGFALVRSAEGALVSSAALAKTQATLRLSFHDGSVTTNTGSKPSKKSEKKPTSQGSLF